MSRRRLAQSLILIGTMSSIALAEGPSGLPKPPGSGLAAAPINPSQPKADPAKVAARAAKLVDQGGAALHAGDAQAALENFLDAKLLLDRQRIRIEATNPIHFAVLEGLGTSYLALGRYEKANDPLERAYPSPLRGRSLTINRAILDLVQHVNVMHGIKELKDYIAKQSAPDELAMNVLGSSMGLASNDEHLFQTAFFQSVGEFYQAKNRELEATHRGQRRWGTAWLNSVQAKIELDKEAEGVKKYKAAIEDVRAADQEMRAAQAAKDGASSAAAAFDANKRYLQAKADLAAGMSRQKTAWKEINRPEWPKTYPPLLPQFAGGGVFGQPDAPQPEMVAVATPKPPIAPPLIPNSDSKITPPRPADPPIPPKSDTPSNELATPPKRMVSRSAVAVPVGPDLLLTAAAPLENASDFKLESADSNVFTAELVRKDATSGLALLRVKGQTMPYLNLASNFEGGEISGWGYPEVAVFSPVPEAIPGSSQAPKASAWKISLRRPPRLAGTAILDKTGSLVGISLGDRDAVMTQIPTATLEQIRAFLADDAPKSRCSNPNPAGILQLTASRDAQ